MDDEEYKVEYTGRLGGLYSLSKTVFKGTVMRGRDEVKSDVVIKFTATYCEDAHRKLAEIGRAPRLRFCELVDSVGMYVVIMDYEDGKHACAPSEERHIHDRCTPLVGERHIEELRTVVKTLHEEGYVHGDIREPNVLITASGLKLIDFDWCGKEGTARYPADIFLDCENMKWHKGVGRGGRIEKSHDEHMFECLTGRSFAK